MAATNPVGVFLQALNDRDVGTAFSVVAGDAPIKIPAAGVIGTASIEGRTFFEATVTAFPDLTLTINDSFAGTDGVVVTELTMEGTQAADYLGIINQEKHVDVDQVWLMKTGNGMIRSIAGYWCQNQLYRRLAVKRLDQVAIV